MRAKKCFAGILTVCLILQSICLGGCGGKKEYEEKPEGDVFRYWLQWYTTGARNEELKRPDGTLPSWDWLTAKDMGVNMMHIYFAPADENGKAIGGLPNTDALEELCEKMQYEINETHKAGIKLIAFSTDVQVKDREIEKMGYDVRKLAAVVNGEIKVDFNWDPEGTYIACINSPEWREWLGKNMEIISKAGFDGVQYDYGPYAAQGGNCHCQYCVDSWAEYSEKTTGVKRSVPEEGLDLTKPEDREYIKWKVKCHRDFIEETLAKAKKYNPDFKFIMNESVMSNTFASMCLSGVYDMTSSEYWGVDIGNDSSLFMYALNEALGFENLTGIFNTAEQVEPEYRLKVAMAESYGVNGGVSFSFNELCSDFTSFIGKYPELFLKTESKAETAILFSAESALFSGYANEPAVIAGKQMGYSKVPFDYVVIEKEDALEKLNRYDTVVIPDFAYFGEDWKPVVKKILRSGKYVIVMGENAKEYLRTFAGSKKSRVQYTEPGTPLHKYLEKTPAYDLIRDESEYFGGGELEFTVRSFKGQYDIVHAVRMGRPYAATEDYASITYEIPKGKKVSSVTAYSPYGGDPEKGGEISAEWSLSKGTLKVKTEGFDTYCIIKIDYFP